MKTYYQPIHYCYEPGNPDEIAMIPEGLWDFQAFESPQEADRWLVNNGYNILDYDIHEYHDDDIEEVVIIDAKGNII